MQRLITAWNSWPRVGGGERGRNGEGGGSRGKEEEVGGSRGRRGK